MSANSCSIIIARPSDLEGIHQLQCLAGYNAWSETQVAKLIARETVLVCLNSSNDALLGFVFFSVVLDEAELLNIVVNPNYRQQGWAEKLLLALKQQLKSSGAATLFLEVAEDNTAALALYKKHQFKQIAVRKNYYKQASGHYDAHVLSLSLSH